MSKKPTFSARKWLMLEDGALTLTALYFFMSMVIFAGLAIDVSNAVQARAQLQGATDAAGHVALYERQNENETTAITSAIAIAEENMPTDFFGNIIASAEVEFGDWDRASRTFTPDPGNRTAVRVTASRLDSRGNSVVTFFLRLVGVDRLELNTVSIWDAEDGLCPPRTPGGERGEGFFAAGVVDMQTSNGFHDGFCVHSDSYVKVSTDNFFEDRTYVSMPAEYPLDVTDVIQMPNDGLDKNPGLEEALHADYHDLADFFANDFDDFVDTYFDPSDTVVTLGGGDALDMQALRDASGGGTPSGTYRINCTGNSFNIAQNEEVTGVTLVTDCKVNFLQGSSLVDATLVTTNTRADSVTGPAGAQFGSRGYCDPVTGGTGGTYVITKGGVRFASDFEAHGTNIMAAGSVQVAANAEGLNGINVLSGGDIDVTSLSDFGFCGFGPPPNPLLFPVFRMVT